MKNRDNIRWTMKDIAKQYKYENPDWSWSECWSKAKVIHKELKKLNNDMWQNNKLFFQMNTPFSFFDNKDDEFSDKPCDGGME